MNALSLHTSSSSMAAQRAASNAVMATSLAGERLGTGYRINSAMDDAAGLQIATRIESASRGMAVALRNIQNGVSLIQVADGAMSTAQNLLIRMQELTLESANGTASDLDREAMQQEFDAVSDQLFSQIGDTSFGGELLFSKTVVTAAGTFRPLGGKMGDGPMTFQVGASDSETITVDFSTGSLLKAREALSATSLKYRTDAPGSEVLAPNSALAALHDITVALDAVGTFRSDLGAIGNRLEHTGANISNMKTNADVSRGRIMDADYAQETANHSRGQMLLQVSTSMLKQSGTLKQMTLSLLQ